MNTKQPESAFAVLVIDDSDIDRETMMDMLSDVGFQVHGLPSPIGATKKARDLGVKVVVIDQHLPAMDGSKLAALFRGNALLRGVRVVLVSGDDESKMRQVADEALVDAFASKRNLHPELAAAVRRLTR